MPDLTQKSLAAICDVSPTRIRQLVAEGAITKNKRGKYSESAITEYIRFLRRAHEEQTGQKEESDFRDLLEQEKYREKKRENDHAEKLLAPVEVIHEVVEKGVASVIAVMETLPLLVKRQFPEITGDQITLVKTAVAECRNAMADVKVVIDDD